MPKRPVPSNSTEKKADISNDPQPVPDPTPVIKTGPKIIKVGPA